RSTGRGSKGAAFLPRPIHSEAEYDATVAVMNALAVRDEKTLDRGEQDYLDVLSMLISDYDENHATIPDASPRAVLRHLLTANDMSVSDLGQVIGSQPGASMILNGRRCISKSQAFKLARRFSVTPDLFLAPVETQRTQRTKSVKARRARMGVRFA
ncbi:MAG TPA: helix-turn-helix domain-containing protein, partial [Tepidisphaeraceae bacterium]|nr:helix-turn-helix domain-containing protein [Tepidisphaeraceae bacterium]